MPVSPHSPVQLRVSGVGEETADVLQSCQDVPTEKLMGLTLEPPGYDDLTAPVGAFLEQIGGTGDKFTLMGTTKQQAVEIMNQAHEACDRRAWTELCAATG
eukprot:1531644-Pyramimonas_sp.AAC.1